MRNNTLADIADLLQSSKCVAVACHVRPDGDALGSAFALCLALKNAGKRAYMLCEDGVPERLHILSGMSPCYTNLPVPITDLDLFVTVDCAEVVRIGRQFDAYCLFGGNTLNIDHHVSNPGFAMYNYVFPDSTATCELMPEIFKAAGFEITKEIADLLAIGLLTDSGNFSHKDVSAKTFAVASTLRACGADFYYIGYMMFTHQTKARALLYKRVVNSLRFALDDKIAFITVTQNDFMETGTDKSHTEGFVDFPLSIEGVEVAVSIMEVRRNQYKISLRSRNIDVNAVAERFGGGGHKLASGCMINGEYEEVIEMITDIVYRQL